LRWLGYFQWIPALSSKDSRAAVKDTQQEEAKKLSLSLHHLSVQNHLLKHENEGSIEILHTKRSTRRRAKPLTFNSAESIMVGLSSGILARWGRHVLERLLEREIRLRRDIRKHGPRRRKSILNSSIKLRMRRGVWRERLMVVREKEKADKAAEQERQKWQQDSGKAIQLSQKGKRQVS
jgi:hypothetical protein